MSGSILFILLTTLLALLIPWILKTVIDSLKDYPSSQPMLLRYSIFLVLVSALEGVFRFYMRRLLISASRKIEYSIRNDFFSHLQTLDSTFFENNRTGSIMALISNDLDAVRNFLGPGLLNLFNTVFVFFSTIIIMFMISPRLTLYSLVAIPLLPVIVSRLSATLHSRFKISQEHYALLSARTQESIAGIKVTKSFTQENNEIDNFSKLNQEYIVKNMELAKIRSIFWPVMILVGGIGSLLVLMVGGRQVIGGSLTLGQFVQFSSYIIFLTWPLISLGWVINLVQRGEVSMGRLNKVFGLTPVIKEPASPLNKSYLNGDIEFKGVFFKYPVIKAYELYDGQSPEDKSRWILQNINISIKAGMQAGIVGFTGCGKSTAANLVPRLYDPQKGLVLIDGVDIKKISLKVLRPGISYTTQDPFIFSKTIRENILFGVEKINQSVTDNELIEKKVISVSKTAHLHEDVQQFPQGYDTIIGERGITLSGGQKQRLAIARALMTSPNILILDDSFSNIDTGTEELILQDLKKNTADMTKIIISHRISTIKDSDIIIVMDEGQITHTGKHEELLKKSEIYKNLYHRQQLAEELEEEL
ncbi:MAG: ABC transporter ATP-binding protein [Actinobacteria bacterium]|nr:ABC transporter ATP-binding protein [Actinomycetota bacterium]